MDELTRKITKRLVISTIAFVISMILSGVAFYYFYVRAPIVPAVVGLTGAPAMAILLMSLYDLRQLKLKKFQPLH
jgi:hypothetical protein